MVNEAAPGNIPTPLRFIRNDSVGATVFRIVG